MDNRNTSFEIGEIQCVLVSDGHFEPPGNSANILFSNAPPEALEAERRIHNIDKVSPYSGMLVRTNGRVVLIDTGAGRRHPTAGKLLDNLKVKGVSPNDIDTVVLTHAHPDHIGGSAHDNGDPVFKRARYIISEVEWNFWHSDEETTRITNERMRERHVRVARTAMTAIEPQTELVSGEFEVAPGVSVIPATGHTPGHMAVVIASGGVEMLDVADAVLHPIHIARPEWYALVDIIPDEMVTTRRQLLAQAAQSGALVRAYHFPWPGLGHVIEADRQWSWRPEVP